MAPLLRYYPSRLAIYYLFFYPMSSSPDAFFCRIGILPCFYHACKGDRHFWMWQNYQIYDDTSPAGPNIVLFGSPREYNDIHGIRANIKRGRFYKA
ncbi:hypothetical protein P280DRAFT_411261 [Massarina eburnea CBS 473.64]|uniref:Uncharacterized protein n=1 Tax=Massarina eburnea CBS 473.64 TaxID=1395130 RepID=A0A6A6RKM6_9PLEO|nr:hypothetical protein P280DRAFT_411261 [Massarina eburnea CBS 473.64]